MRSLIVKLTFLQLVILVLIVQQLHAQDYCSGCSIDSLYQQVGKKKTDGEKVKLLRRIVLSVLYSGDGPPQITTIDSLIKLNEETKIINASPYIAYRAALFYYRDQKYEQSLVQLKIAVKEFDKEKSVINPVLLMFRVLYNNLDRQQERHDFFQAKLNYYLVNGPIANTAACYHGLGGYYIYKGNYDLAISNYLRAAEVFKKFAYSEYMNDINVIGVEYANWGNFDKAEHYLNMSLPWVRNPRNAAISSSSYLLMALSNISLKHKDYNKALNYADESINSVSGKTLSRDYATALLQKGLIYLTQNQPLKAYPFLVRSKSISDTVTMGSKLFSVNGSFEKDFAWYLYYKQSGNYGAAEKSLLAAYNAAVLEKINEYQLKYLGELSRFYADQNKPGPAKIYLNKYFALDDVMQAEQNSAKIAQYENEQKDNLQAEKINNLRQERIVQAAVINKSRVITTVSLTALLLLSCATFFIYRQFQNNKKTLSSLRKTQRQLIQSEKMASLGELTAGVAHEIQNPLNFVNNFSEVSIELLDEMQGELQSGDKDEAIAIAADVKQNLEKIRHHGQRADSIVKGMLQHSRASSNTKELADINKLADEYLRLAYHGLRAKDKNFNCELVTTFDEKLPLLNMVPQDIGRVLVNLFTNAFYSVNQKQQTAVTNYKPEVSATTSMENGQVIIKVKDNGNGIPDAIKDKIMQPFFTTKPTGEGTGLGLSLSYDIIVKGHSGTIGVNSVENEFTEFTIKLPA